MNVIEAIEKEQLRSDIPEFRPGDTLKVYVKVVEGTVNGFSCLKASASPGAVPVPGKCSPSAVLLPAWAWKECSLFIPRVWKRSLYPTEVWYAEPNCIICVN